MTKEMKRDAQAGLTLVETLIAMGIVTLTVATAYPMLSLGVRMNHAATGSSSALNYARQQLETELAAHRQLGGADNHLLFADGSSGFEAQSHPSDVDPSSSANGFVWTTPAALPSPLSGVLTNPKVVTVNLNSGGRTRTVGTIVGVASVTN